MRPFIIILLLKCKWGVTKQNIIKTNKQPPTYQGGFMWLSRLWITFALACEDILMWAFPGRETMGYTWAHINSMKEHILHPRMSSLWGGPWKHCCHDSHLSVPPPHTHTHTINLSQGETPFASPPCPPTVEPVCASLCHPCSAQTNKTFCSEGVMGGERQGRGGCRNRI